MNDRPTSPWAQWPELVIIAGHIGNLCCSEMAVLEVAWVLRTQQKLPNHQETEKHKTRNQFTKNKYKNNLKVNYRSLSSIQLLQPGCHQYNYYNPEKEEWLKTEKKTIAF